MLGFRGVLLVVFNKGQEANGFAWLSTSKEVSLSYGGKCKVGEGDKPREYVTGCQSDLPWLVGLYPLLYKDITWQNLPPVPVCLSIQ